MITLHTTAACIGDGHTPCDWTAAGPGSDKAAAKHGKDTGHSTCTDTRPTEEKR